MGQRGRAVLAGCEWILSSFVFKQHNMMVSSNESAGTKCFSEAQLKAMVGVFQGLLDKALTNRAQGGTTSESEDENAERDPTR